MAVSFMVYGMVVRCVNYRDYDRILTLVSPERGKLTVCARNVRRPASKRQPAAQMFCYGEFELTQNREQSTLSACHIEDNFYNLSSNLDALSHATYMVNACEEAFLPNEPNQALFALLTSCVSYLSYSDIPAKQITIVFLIQLMNILGFKPQTDTCIHCHKKIEGLANAFHPEFGGVLCAVCSGIQGAVPMGKDALYLLNYLSNIPLDRLDTVKISKSVQDDLYHILQQYVAFRIEKKFRSLRFMEVSDKQDFKA